MPFEVFDELWAGYGLNSDPLLRLPVARMLHPG